jgi:excinuclease UvrABC nuclease subunit
VRDVRLLLEGRNKELADTLEERMLEASEATALRARREVSRSCAKTVIRLSEQQKMATTSKATSTSSVTTEKGTSRAATLHDARRQHRRAA